MKLKNIKYGVPSARSFYLSSINSMGCFLKTFANPIKTCFMKNILLLKFILISLLAQSQSLEVDSILDHHFEKVGGKERWN